MAMGDLSASDEPVRLLFQRPFDGRGLLSFLERRAVPGVEQVDVVSATYRRTFRIASGTGSLEVRYFEELAHLTLSGCPDVLPGLVERCRRLFDLDLVPSEVAAVLGADPILAPLVAATPGLRVPGAWDGFELAVRAVLGQQVSVAAARTLLGRLTALVGLTAPSGCAAVGLDLLFPTAEEVADADLQRLGVPVSRRRTLRALAEAVAAGRLTLEPGADPVETRGRLLELPGIGPWTAAYVALRALGDNDSLLVGDLALAKAAVRCGLPGTWPELVARAERWRPWRGYASLWLWTAV
jgi:AraC family transcriptional regulator of adaptative response / DNA-3-methyladenine glycosylase II